MCSGYQTCDSCRANPSCGWCDDGSLTGLGSCHVGGARGPMVERKALPPSSRSEWILEPSVCPASQAKTWHFTSCPGKVLSSYLSDVTRSDSPFFFPFLSSFTHHHHHHSLPMQRPQRVRPRGPRPRRVRPLREQHRGRALRALRRGILRKRRQRRIVPG